MSFQKSVASTVGLNIYTFLVGFVNSILAARMLGAEGRGIFSIYTSSVELLSMLLGLGVPHALLYFAAKDRFDRSRLFTTTLFFLLVTTLIFCIVVSISIKNGFGDFFLPHPFQDASGQWMIGVYFLGLMGWYLLVSILNGHRFFVQTNFISLINISGMLIVYAILFILLPNPVSPFVFFFVQMSMSVVTLGLCFYFNKRLVENKGTHQLLDKESILTIVKYGLLMYACNLMLFVSLKLDYWFINYFAGATALGVYTLAANVGLMMLLLPNSIGLVLTAFKANETVGRVDEWTAFLCRLSFTISLLAAIALYLMGDPVIQFLYGDDFEGAFRLLCILLPGIVPYCVFTVLKNYFAGAGRLNDLLFVSILGIAVTVVLDCLLIPTHGAVGAAFASICAYLTSTLVACWRFQVRTGISLFLLFVLSGDDIRIIKKAITNLFRS
ncbi:MAG: oligosaccharide flippase family protein [Cyclobacteriaceae bacterium]|nr:oligosaccharide flippase family protein [Cyclobacteriaceae bacterium]